jgi:hypothetical protein
MWVTAKGAITFLSSCPATPASHLRAVSGFGPEYLPTAVVRSLPVMVKSSSGIAALGALRITTDNMTRLASFPF